MPYPYNHTYPRPLYWWLEPIMPITYDNSLSYMELLNKVIVKLNEVIDTISGQLTPELMERINDIFATVTYIEETHTIALELEVDDNA